MASGSFQVPFIILSLGHYVMYICPTRSACTDTSQYMHPSSSQSSIRFELSRVVSWTVPRPRRLPVFFFMPKGCLLGCCQSHLLSAYATFPKPCHDTLLLPGVNCRLHHQPDCPTHTSFPPSTFHLPKSYYCCLSPDFEAGRSGSVPCCWLFLVYRPVLYVLVIRHRFGSNEQPNHQPTVYCL